MEKWKKKIFKAMYKQWWSRQKVSAEDIVGYFNSPKNNFEIYQGLLNIMYNSWYFKYYVPLKFFIIEKVLKKKIDLN